MREQFPGPVALPLEATNFPPTLQLPTLLARWTWFFFAPRTVPD